MNELIINIIAYGIAIIILLAPIWIPITIIILILNQNKTNNKKQIKEPIRYNNNIKKSNVNDAEKGMAGCAIAGLACILMLSTMLILIVVTITGIFMKSLNNAFQQSGTQQERNESTTIEYIDANVYPEDYK